MATTVFSKPTSVVSGKIIIDEGYTNWSQIWDVLGNLQLHDIVSAFISPAAMAIISNNAFTTFFQGTICVSSSGIIGFHGKTASNQMISAYLGSPSANSPGSWNIKHILYDVERPIYYLSSASSTAHTFNVPLSSRNFVFASSGSGAQYTWAGYISNSSGGTITIAEIGKGASITVSNINVSNAEGTVTFTVSGSTARAYNLIVLNVGGGRLYQD